MLSNFRDHDLVVLLCMALTPHNRALVDAHGHVLLSQNELRCGQTDPLNRFRPWQVLRPSRGMREYLPMIEEPTEPVASLAKYPTVPCSISSSSICPATPPPMRTTS